MTDYPYAPPEPVEPTIPARVRTWCYALGALLGLGVAPALLALDLPKWSAALACFAGAANALAWGHRPTKQVTP